MTTPWLRVRQLFLDCLEQPASERDAWLAQACAGDGVLLGEVGALLAAQSGPTDILDRTAMDLIKDMPDSASPINRRGQQIGAYRLSELIGEGGMGSVFLAERSDGAFAQRVALKLVRSDLLKAGSHDRFLREREVLARLSHPHIAQLRDGGVADDGTPYFTMEFVEGEAITNFCDERRLGIRERVRLVMQVCAAVSYAHANLIVHRDLKPSNIFVTADAQVKLLDFGIAKLLDTDIDKGQTNTQSRMMTPEYAAPEQVLGEPITTATDVYAIGVLLYELLSGRLPYARADAGATSWSKAVIEELPEPAHRAISRLATRDAARSAQAVAYARGLELHALRRGLRGDLDRILQRALAKAPEARYANTAAMSADLAAYLDGRAISGGTQTYRTRKFIRRFWLPLTAATAVLITLAGSEIAIVRQSQKTEHEARTTSAVKDFLFGLFAAVDPREANGRDISARELLDRGAESIGVNQTLDEVQKGEILATLGRIYYQLGFFKQANALQESALQSVEQAREKPALLLQIQEDRVDTLTELGDQKNAALLANDARDKVDALTEATLSQRARARHAQVRVALDHRDYVHAEQFAKEELALLSENDTDPATRYAAFMSAGASSWGLTKTHDAEAYFRLALDVAMQKRPVSDFDIARARGNIGLTLQNESRYVEAAQFDKQALEDYQRVLTPDHPMVLGERRDLALVQYHLGHYADARTTLEQVVSEQRKNLGSDNPAVAGSDINLGLVLLDSGDLDAAERAFDDAVAIFEKKFSREYPGVRIALGDLAALHTQQTRLELAEKEIAEVVADEANAKAPPLDTVITRCRVAELRRLRGDASAAAEIARSALADSQKGNGEGSRFTALSHETLGRALLDEGNRQDAELEFRAALASVTSYIPNAEHPLAATIRYELGEVLLKDANTSEEGDRMLAEAATIREKLLGANDPRTLEAQAAVQRRR
jgi:eukaryotic-like serine/threonine-protein kinase